MSRHNGLVAVTGASGHLGANLVRALIERGRPLRLLVRDDQRAFAELPAEKVAADIEEPRSLARAFSGVEVVYHLAGKVSIERGHDEEMRRANVDGVRNVMQACLDAGVRRVVHFSSIHAFAQAPLLEKLDETRAPPGPDAPAYHRSKAAGEREVAAAVHKGLDAVIVNPTAVLGPWDFKPSPLGEALLGLANGRLPALVEGGFDWVDARDVVAGAMAAEERGRTGERYLLSGSWLPMGALAGVVEEITGVPKPRFTCPMWLARAGAPVVESFCKMIRVRPLYTSASLEALRSNRHVSHEKAARELGYSPRTLRETIVDTLRWHQEQGNCPAASRLRAVSSS